MSEEPTQQEPHQPPLLPLGQDEKLVDLDFKQNDRFHVHQWIDCLDAQRKWYEAQIRDLDPDGYRIFVHYRGFKAHFDEWINLKTDSHRIARLNSETQAKKPKFAINPRIQPGELLDCEDSIGKICEARVVAKGIIRDQIMLKVTYVGWSEVYDEWINADSYRLNAHRSLTGGQSAGNLVNLDYNLKRFTNQMNVSEMRASTPSAEELFRERLRRDFGARIVVQAGDGNCLFRSVSHQVYGDPSHHLLVRRFCVDYMELEADYFSNFVTGGDDGTDFKSYADNMRKSGAWGDHLEIQAMSEIYERPIFVYAYSTTPLRTYRDDQADRIPIRLSYHFSSHYNSVVIDGLTEAAFTTALPGVLEEEALNRVVTARLAGIKRDRNVPASESAVRPEASAIDEEMKLALEVSRMHQDVIPLSSGEDEEMKLALEVSRMDQDIGPASIGDAALNLAIAESLRVAAPNLDMVADPELEAVIMESLKPQEPMKFAVPESAIPKWVQDLNNDSIEIPWVVEECMNMGFSKIECIEAFKKLFDENVSPDLLLSNMTNFLLSQDFS